MSNGIALRRAALTILSGQTKSDAIFLGNAPLRGLFVPAGFTGGTLTFEVAPPGAADAAPADGDFVAVRDATNLVMTLNVTAGSYVGFYADALRGALHFRLVAAGAQGANRIFTLVYGA